MPLMCIQCAMKAMVAGEPPPSFDESPEAHQLRVHPDLVATFKERVELEKQILAKLDKEGKA